MVRIREEVLGSEAVFNRDGKGVGLEGEGVDVIVVGGEEGGADA